MRVASAAEVIAWCCRFIPYPFVTSLSLAERGYKPQPPSIYLPSFFSLVSLYNTTLLPDTVCTVCALVQGCYIILNSPYFALLVSEVN